MTSAATKPERLSIERRIEMRKAIELRKNGGRGYTLEWGSDGQPFWN